MNYLDETTRDIYPIGKALTFINKKWSIGLIRDMFSGKRRFKEFREGKPDLSNKVLSERLKDLEEKGIIEKKVDEIKSTATQYYLTQQGKSLNRVIYELAVFSQEKQIAPVNESLALLSKKWNMEIIYDLFVGKKRFNEFKSHRPDLSNKVLSECLKSLEKGGIIEKKILNSKQLSTEYGLTDFGKSLNRLIYELIIFNLENCTPANGSNYQIKEYFRETLKINY